MSIKKAAPFDLAGALAKYRNAFIAIGIMSGAVNMLALTGSMYMLQVYDRVLPSRSVQTLIGLTIIMVMLYTAHGALDFIRTRMMARIGLKIDGALRKPIFNAVLTLPLKTRNEAGGLQPIRDLDHIRSFLSSLGPTALFDLPWVPLFLLLLLVLNPWLSLFAAVSVLTLIAITLLTEAKTAAPSKLASASGAARMTFAESARRNAEVIRAHGIGGRVEALWSDLNARHLGDQLRLSDASSGLGTVSKILRMLFQSGMLGLGAYLAVHGDITPGTIIAGTIILGRALAPIELAIGNWKNFVNARQGYERLKAVIRTIPLEPESMALPRPSKALKVQGLTVAAPGDMRPIVQGVSFDLEAGAGLGVIGPSAAGKSTLVRALVGAWQPLPRGGAVRLDGATLDQYSIEALGTDIGYLPQDIELFDGSVADNIARLDREANPDDIIRAATLAGCHDMILQMPEGYNTRVGESGLMLSAGQRQRVALARALFGDPFLVVLDEPNSNLDAIGDFALSNAIKAVRGRGGIVIIVAHRPSALNGIDTILALANGQVQSFGPKDEVLNKVLDQPAPAARSPLKVVADDRKENAP
jgi:PrtD family type I secretion system ABC transporter